jgi:hypothetical protein
MPFNRPNGQYETDKYCDGTIVATPKRQIGQSISRHEYRNANLLNFRRPQATVDVILARIDGFNLPHFE